jgi:hypothetical protein
MKIAAEIIADILADAREFIEKHGWWRGSLQGPNGRQVCTLGGIYFSQGWFGHTAHHEHQQEVGQCNDFINQALKSRHPSGLLMRQQRPYQHTEFTDMPITDWNDHYAVDKQDVLDTLAKAEKIARAGFDPDA